MRSVSISCESKGSDSRTFFARFRAFKEFVAKQLNLSEEQARGLKALKPDELYQLASVAGITNRQVAKLVAEFLNLPYLHFINPDAILQGVLPVPFCRAHGVVVVKHNGGHAILLSNPFRLDLLDVLKTIPATVAESTQHATYDYGSQGRVPLLVTEPENIEPLLANGSPDPRTNHTAPQSQHNVVTVVRESQGGLSEREIEKSPIVHTANSILYAAVSERASDAHIEPKGEYTIVRFRIDGDMRDIAVLAKETGAKLIARLKALAGLDIADRRRPQDGSMDVLIAGRRYQLRLATTSTPSGESLIIRILDANAKAKELHELGMTPEQAEAMRAFAQRSQGLILVVGPTGSGKTTTIYSLLSQIDCTSRSLATVEDPVEYTIPYANQQQVNEKAGITFESLLKSSVRQDPDILFLGEIRDPYSARTAIDFASTGHLTISTLHTANATSAIFRLERLGVARAQMAEALLAIVAQRLLKKLCPHCKKILPITPHEAELLAPYTEQLPDITAHPVGCVVCNNTGYYGREAVYEILEFQPEIAHLVREGAPISEIRALVRQRGGYLISNHAVDKVRQQIFSVKDVYDEVLVEEISSHNRSFRVTADTNNDTKPKILLVEDDADMAALLKHILEKKSYGVVHAYDGVDALMQLGKDNFHLIIADIIMPHLDGFRLLELMNQKGVNAPVIFLTAKTDDADERKGFDLGAADYIKKPIRKEDFLARVERVLAQVRENSHQANLLRS